VGPRAGLDTEATGKILCPRSPGRPVRSQTLYCLSYPDPNINHGYKYKTNRLYTSQVMCKYDTHCSNADIFTAVSNEIIIVVVVCLFRREEWVDCSQLR
jgi:hypothetical protein